MMESLTLCERHPDCSSQPALNQGEPQRRSPQSPSPNGFRSNYETLNHLRATATTHKGDQVLDYPFRESMDSMSILGDVTVPTELYMHNSREECAPLSPPYCASEPEKPSLPPLKTVLGPRTSSPPVTPLSLSAYSPPSPREPTYTTSTYMPPSLYPNKKARVSPPPDSGTHLLTASIFSSMEQPRSKLATPFAKYPLEATRTRHSSLNDCIYSNNLPNAPQMAYHLPPPVAPAIPSTPNRLATISTQMHRMPRFTVPSQFSEPKHVAATAEPALASRGPEPSCRDSIVQEDRPSSRRYSNNGYGPRFEKLLESSPYQPSSYQPGCRCLHSTMDDCCAPTNRASHVRQNEVYGPPTQRSRYNRCEARQESFFIASQYEFQQSKARKRSNLPKQSTEIMRTWFDQNISNPYPTEEQKAVFSSVTGISMTQVSNWFINHRRRCPGLKDKREKSRDGIRKGEL